MQNIGQIIKELISEKKLTANTDQLLTQALQDPDVQAFLKQNANQITKEMVQRDLINIYLFVAQKHKPSAVTEGYEPELFVNEGSIDVTYHKTAAKLAQEKKQRDFNKLQLIDLPPRLHRVRLSQLDRNPERKEALAKIATFLQKFARDPHLKGLYLSGNFGVGKTYILAGLANQLAAMGSEVVFLHVPTFISSLSSHFEDNSLPAQIKHLSTAPILILDDIGAESLSQWSRDDVLGVILQHRMDNILPTFFSSNFDMENLEKHFAQTKNAIDPVKAARLMQRVRFLAEEVVVSGPNRR